MNRLLLLDVRASIKVLQLSKSCPFLVKRNLSRTKIPRDSVTLKFSALFTSLPWSYNSQLQRKIFYNSSKTLSDISLVLFSMCLLTILSKTRKHLHVWDALFIPLLVTTTLITLMRRYIPCVYCVNLFFFVFVLDTLSLHKYLISHPTVNTKF